MKRTLIRVSLNYLTMSVGPCIRRITPPWTHKYILTKLDLNSMILQATPYYYFRRVRNEVAKIRLLASPYVCPHITTREQLNGFFLKYVFV
jgi:hypothetical protein